MLGGFHLGGSGETAFVDETPARRAYVVEARGGTSDCVADLVRACARHSGCDAGRIDVTFRCGTTDVALPVPVELLGGAPESCGAEGPRLRHAEGFERPFRAKDDARAFDVRK